ncbi:MAG: efflux RND transporter permease subunit, partial [Woeseiaceae bacterium]|nr:efflux RND transporter permease subunit [Woeseiaceae bacterium]
MKHTEFSLARPVTTIVVFVALAMVGLIATRLLPLEKFPDIEFPGIFIQIPYDGSTPEEIERLITRPVEEVLATLSGVERMFSSSDEGQAQIFLQFDWDQNMGAKGIEARSKVDGIRHQLPDDVRRVFVFTGSLGDQPVLQLRISSERDLSDSYAMLDRLLKRRLERLEGVSRVELQGVDPREIRILLRSDALAAHSVDIAALREMLISSNFAVSAGQLTAGDQRLSVRPRGEFGSVDEIRNLAINASGLRLGDVADVELRTPERNYGRHLDRDYAIGVAINKTTGSNLVDVTDRVIAEVEEIGQLPQMQGINIFPLDNQGDSVRDSLSDLLNAGLVGGLLAVLVLYLFLRQVTTTLIVIAAIPFSLLITLGALYFAGLSLNILSMMGLMLAVGMLVDNGVVVTESIFRHRAAAPDKPVEATIAGVREVGLAVIAGTATTIIVFAPIIFGAKSDMTVFLTHVAVTIIVALGASLLLAQTLIPMLAARVDIPPQPKSGAFLDRLTRRYTKSLRWELNHPWWTALGILLICVVGVLPMALQLVKVDMFPQDVGRRLFMPYHIEGQHSLERIEATVDTIEEFLYSRQEEFNIRSVYSYYDQGRAESTLLLTDEDDATLSTTEIIELIEKDLPTIAIGKPSFQFDQQGGGEGFSLQLSGDSTALLNELGVEVARSLASIEGLNDIRSDAETGEKEVRVSIDRDRAAANGLTAATIAQTISLAMRGENLREFRGETGEIAMRIAFRDHDRQSVEQLADLPLFTPEGRRVPLGSVATLHVGRAPDTIRRTDRQTAVILSATLGDEVTMDSVRPKVQALMDQIDLPPGYSWKFGRGFERQDDTQQMMMQNILLGIACIFLVMAALF